MSVLFWPCGPSPVFAGGIDLLDTSHLGVLRDGGRGHLVVLVGHLVAQRQDPPAGLVLLSRRAGKTPLHAFAFPDGKDEPKRAALVFLGTHPDLAPVLMTQPPTDNRRMRLLRRALPRPGSGAPR